jgi:hypothetical protein
MLGLSWQTYDQYGYALIVALGTLAAVAGVHWLLVQPRWAGWVRSLHGVAPPFINVIGVLFGLTLAFLANDTWSAHDRAMNAVYVEADALRGMGVLTGAMPAPLRQAVRQALSDYARASAAEWPQLARRQPDPAVSQRADALLALLASREVAASVGDGVQRLLLQKASEIRAQRDQRIGLCQTHVNPLKWLGMAFLGFVTLLSVMVVHVEQPRAALAAVVLFALAAAPTAAIVLVQGNPFQQPTAVSSAPIADAARVINPTSRQP